MTDNKADPPVAPRVSHEFTHHGITVQDPYHWLQDANYPDVKDPQVLAYLRQENDYFESVMGEHQSLTDELFNEIKARMKEDDAAVPWREGEYIYRWRFEQGSEYRIWSRRHESGEDEQIILDEPEAAAGLEYYAVADLAISPDGKLMAWTVDNSGAERFTLRVKNLVTGEMLDDVIEETHGEVVWSEDSQGFFYTLVNHEWRPDRALYHRLGDDQDRLIYQESDASFFVDIAATQSRKWLVLGTGDHVTSEVRLVPLNEPESEPVLIATRQTGHEYHVNHARDQFIIRTNDQHKNYRVVTAPEDNPTPEHWTELLPSSDTNYYRGLIPLKGFLAVQERSNGLDQIRLRTWDGETHFVEFPEAVYAAGLSTNPEYDQQHLRLAYQSMISPSTTYDYDPVARQLELKKQQEIPSGYDKSEYTTERLMAPARDGVQVPVTLVYRKDFVTDGNGKLHLYGYGAYGSGTAPGFSAARLSLLNRGFAYAIAHVRGGDEMGYQWYEDGKLDKRTNTFNDFVDVAQFLVDQDYCQAGNLSASGGSAGGELMGAAIVQAPELWRAVVLHVPFVDVLNTMLDDSLPLTPIEWPEWGNPLEDKSAFLNIQSYSPYDNIEPRSYPMQMVTGGLNDPRVTYWEPAKWTARMRAMKTDDNLLVMKINMGAGHGGKTGRFQRIQETAEEFTFILKAFGLAS
jgi:oligopeptidase B